MSDVDKEKTELFEDGLLVFFFVFGRESEFRFVFLFRGFRGL